MAALNVPDQQAGSIIRIRNFAPEEVDALVCALESASGTNAERFAAELISAIRQRENEQAGTSSPAEADFAFHVSRWRRETRHYSSLSKMVLHPSYLRIIGMGRAILPLLFRELEARRDHWLVALNAITGEDPAAPDSSFAQAVDAWLQWGREKGYSG